MGSAPSEESVVAKPGEGLHIVGGPNPNLISNADPTSSVDLISPTGGLESNLANQHSEIASTSARILLRVCPASSQAMNPEYLSHLNEMLDRIQSLSILNDHTLVYDKMDLKSTTGKFTSHPPPT